MNVGPVEPKESDKVSSRRRDRLGDTRLLRGRVRSNASTDSIKRAEALELVNQLERYKQLVARKRQAVLQEKLQLQHDLIGSQDRLHELQEKQKSELKTKELEERLKARQSDIRAIRERNKGRLLATLPDREYRNRFKASRQNAGMVEATSDSVESEKVNHSIASWKVSRSSAGGVGCQTGRLAFSRGSACTDSGKMFDELRANASPSGGAEEVWTQIRAHSRQREHSGRESSYRKAARRYLSLNPDDQEVRESYQSASLPSGRDTLCLLHLMYRTSEQNRYAADRMLRRTRLPHFAQPDTYREHKPADNAPRTMTTNQDRNRADCKPKEEIGKEGDHSPLEPCSDLTGLSQASPGRVSLRLPDNEYSLPAICKDSELSGSSLRGLVVAPRGWEPLTLSALMDYAPQCKVSGKGPFLSGQPTMWRAP